MSETAACLIAAGVSLLGSIIMALVAWGWRAEIATLRAENGTLKAQLQADIAGAVGAFGTMRAEMATLSAEMRANIAESVNTFFLQVNGNYVKKELYNTLISRVDGLETRVNDIGD